MPSSTTDGCDAVLTFDPIDYDQAITARLEFYNDKFRNATLEITNSEREIGSLQWPFSATVL